MLRGGEGSKCSVLGSVKRKGGREEKLGNSTIVPGGGGGCSITGEYNNNNNNNNVVLLRAPVMLTQTVWEGIIWKTIPGGE